MGRQKCTQTIRTQSERRSCCVLTELAGQEGSLEEEMCGLGLEKCGRGLSSRNSSCGVRKQEQGGRGWCDEGLKRATTGQGHTHRQLLSQVH